MPQEANSRAYFITLRRLSLSDGFFPPAMLADVGEGSGLEPRDGSVPARTIFSTPSAMVRHCFMQTCRAGQEEQSAAPPATRSAWMTRSTLSIWDRGMKNIGFLFKVQGSRFKVQGSRFKVQGSRFKVQGL
jgi:hypothetical protein